VSLDRAAIRAAFAASVNMDADTLTAWLETDESRSVGQKKDGGESVGHAAGRRIAHILRSGAESEEDWRLMRKAVGVIRRHRAQEPANIVTSRWRYALMNWGHDPLT
jgi:predicted NAD/FAD-dependent oxidoreductase